MRRVSGGRKAATGRMPKPSDPFSKRSFLRLFRDYFGRPSSKSLKLLERVKGIEPSSSAWKVDCLVPNYLIYIVILCSMGSGHSVNKRGTCTHAHLLREQGVGSSNLPAPTNDFKALATSREYHAHNMPKIRERTT